MRGVEAGNERYKEGREVTRKGRSEGLCLYGDCEGSGRGNREMASDV